MPELLEFLEFLDEIIDYDDIKKEYGMSYTQISEYMDQLKEKVQD